MSYSLYVLNLGLLITAWAFYKLVAAIRIIRSSYVFETNQSAGLNFTSGLSHASALTFLLLQTQWLSYLGLFILERVRWEAIILSLSVSCRSTCLNINHFLTIDNSLREIWVYNHVFGCAVVI